MLLFISLHLSEEDKFVSSISLHGSNSLVSFSFSSPPLYLCRLVKHASNVHLNETVSEEKRSQLQGVSTNECNLSYLGHCIFWQRRGKHQRARLYVYQYQSSTVLSLSLPAGIWQTIVALRLFKPRFYCRSNS